MGMYFLPECVRCQGNKNKCGCHKRMPMMQELNSRVILIDEIREALNEMKSRKAPGQDGFQVWKPGFQVRMVFKGSRSGWFSKRLTKSRA